MSTSPETVGIKDFLRSNSVGRKTFWVLTVVCLITISLTTSVMEVHRYLMSDTQLSVHNTQVQVLDSPTIMICYAGGLDVDSMTSDGFSDGLLKALRQPWHLVRLDSPTKALLNEELTDHMKRLDVHSVKDILNRYKYPCSSLISPVHSYLWEADDDLCESAKSVFHYNFHNCYQFNSLFQQSSPGTLGGMWLALKAPSPNLNSLSYFGIELFDGHFLRTDNHKILPLGYRILLSLEKKYERRLETLSFPKRQARCLSDSNTGSICFHKCVEEMVAKNCGCRFLNDEQCSDQTSWCSPLLDVSCMNFTQSKECSRYCLMPCETVEYGVTVSSAPIFEERGNVVNYSELLIAYSELAVIGITEYETYPLVALASNIGGLLGLWLGISTLSLVQAIFLCTVGYGNGTEISDSDHNRSTCKK